MGLFNFFKRKNKNNTQSINTDYVNDIDLATSDAASSEAEDEITVPNDIANNKDVLYSGMQVAEENQESALKEQENIPKDKKNDTLIENDAVTEKEVPSSYTGRFEINKTKDGKKFFFNLYASNKVGIATSQMYSTAQNALNGIKSVIINAPKAPIEDQSLKSYEILPYPKWEIYVDNGGKFRFRLNASNGSCVCHSQGYTTKTACKNGINSIIKSSRNAEIDKTYLSKN